MKKETKLILIPVLFILSLALLIWAMNRKKTPDVAATSEVKEEVVNRERVLRNGAYTLGNPNAKVHLVEFFDPECEACAAFHPIIKKILVDFKDDLYFQGRYMLYHGNSHGAAMALEAAGEQGKYWELQDILFTRQNEWSHKKESANPYFMNYAKELKLDLKKFEAGLTNQTFQGFLKLDIAEGESFGVRGTPTFFINGRPLMELSDNALRDAIVAELKKP
jgi:protein-disulfide isomerase